ncbi:MAG: HipA family kinase [Candidatus Thiodiazotropha sp.]
MTVEIVEILRRSEQGITKPFICRGDDGEIYFVKGQNAGHRSLICEWIAGRLAVLIGLPVPPFKQVQVPEELVDFNIGTPLDGLGAGPAFGSLERQVTELTVSNVEQVPDKLQQDVLIFDWWVRNADRNLSEFGGNPNLFWEPGERVLVVIDHNQAFDFTVKKSDFSQGHVFAAQTNELSGDFFRRDEYHGKLSMALNEWPQILSEIPETWWFVDEEQTVPVSFDKQTVYELLKGFESEDFWSWK